MFVFYILIGFIIYFFMYKKYMPKIKESLDTSRGHKEMADFLDFWLMVLVPITWPIGLPLLLLWGLLERVYNKYINK